MFRLSFYVRIISGSYVELNFLTKCSLANTYFMDYRLYCGTLCIVCICDFRKTLILDYQNVTVVMTRDSSGARLCVNAAPICEKANHFLLRVPQSCVLFYRLCHSDINKKIDIKLRKPRTGRHVPQSHNDDVRPTYSSVSVTEFNPKGTTHLKTAMFLA